MNGAFVRLADLTILVPAMVFASFVGSFFTAAVLRSRMLRRQQSRKLRKRSIIFSCLSMGLVSGSILLVCRGLVLLLGASRLDLETWMLLIFISVATAAMSSGASALGWLVGRNLEGRFWPDSGK